MTLPMATFFYRFYAWMILVLALGTIASCSGTNAGEQPAEAVHIEVTIEGIEEGISYLGGTLADQFYFVDSMVIDKNGKLTISRDNPLPQGLYYVSLPEWKATLQFLLDEDQVFTARTRWPDYVENMEIEGSVNNTLLYENLQFEAKYQDEYGPLRQQYQALDADSPEAQALKKQLKELIDQRKEHIAGFEKQYPDAFFTKFKLAGQNPELKEPRLPDGTIDRDKQVAMYCREYWDNVDFSDERLLRTPVYSNKIRRYFDEVLPQRIDTLIKYADWLTRQSMQNDSIFKFTANYIGGLYQEPKFMGADAVYVHMVKNFFTHDLAFWSNDTEIDRLQLYADVRASSLLGEKAKNLNVIGLDGESVALYDIKAPLTVLYIYNTNCENCQKETPQLVQLYNDWKSMGIEVFALATDGDTEDWKNYVKRYNMQWVNGIDPKIQSQYTFKYHIDVTPAIYVLDEDKIIVGKDLKVFQLPQIFRKHLNI